MHAILGISIQDGRGQGYKVAVYSCLSMANQLSSLGLIVPVSCSFGSYQISKGQWLPQPLSP